LPTQADALKGEIHAAEQAIDFAFEVVECVPRMAPAKDGHKGFRAAMFRQTKLKQGTKLEESQSLYRVSKPSMCPRADARLHL
jgi:hypothetical protein